MSSVHDVFREDDVSGQIIGSMKFFGILKYCGKKQGQSLFAESHDDLLQAASILKRLIIDACGAASAEIFPEDCEWRLEIIQ